MRLSLREVIDVTGGHFLGVDRTPAEVIVTGVSTDTRTLRPGDLFVPLRGPRTDGHAFLAEALRRGAVAALCVQPRADLPADAVLIQVADPLRALGDIATHYRQTLSVMVIGITGSVGKTTTTKMCASTLGARFRVAQTREEWNAEVGVPLTLLGLTPEHQVALVEMAMRGLGQIGELVVMAKPTIGVVTTVAEAHLEFLGTRENIARAKGELVAGLPDGGTAILNADDQLVAGLAGLCRGRVLTYGLDVAADVTAQAIRASRSGLQFRLVAAGQSVEIDLSTWGRHNVRNALAAAGVGVALGMALGAIRDGLAQYRPPTRRLEPIPVGDVLILNDTYNASPASMLAAFDVLREVAQPEHRIAVLGGMKELGSQSIAMHREIGRALAARGVRLLITVGEDARTIAEGATEAGMSLQAIHPVHEHDEAMALLRAEVRPGDVVLVKGSRAMAMERIVEGVAAWWSSAAGGRRGA